MISFDNCQKNKFPIESAAQKWDCVVEILLIPISGLIFKECDNTFGLLMSNTYIFPAWSAAINLVSSCDNITELIGS